MYKVFFKDSVFLLTDDKNLLTGEAYRLIHNNFNSTKTFIQKLLEIEDKIIAIIYGEDTEELCSISKSCFTYVKAAGGVVRQEDQLLVIKRFGLYDLPKGHVESNESIQECAVREVQEECGLQELQINAPLTDTFHIYCRNNSWFLKKTYWFSMHCSANQTPSPQKEEDIEEAFWLPISEIETAKNNTYLSLLEVFKKITN